MKIIVAGPRDFFDYTVVKEAIESSGFDITEIVSGKAKGVDSLGERWADENGIPKKPFPAEWSNIRRPGAVIRINKFGMKYDAEAGKIRNQQMVDYADGLVVVIRLPLTRGTRDVYLKGKAEEKKREFRVFPFTVRFD